MQLNLRERDSIRSEPFAVWKAANYLFKESDLYKDVQLDTEWLDLLHNDQTEPETSENDLIELNVFDSAERLP